MNNFPYKDTRSNAGGFTVVEIMVSTAIMLIIMVILVQLTGQTSNTWRYTTGKAEQFREARNAFETMSRRISQATLNTYWDYNDPNQPTSYVRLSELRFISGPMQQGADKLDSTGSVPRPTHGIFFQAPFGYVAPANPSDSAWEDYKGLDGALNTWGYYLEVNDDRDLRPTFLTEKYAPYRIRSRLIELREPTGAMSIYKYTSGKPGDGAAAIKTMKNYKGFEWFRTAIKEQPPRSLAENIIALAILPKLAEEDAKEIGLTDRNKETALAPKYFYHSATTGAAGSAEGNSTKAALNSKHQLPPVIQLTMVAIDEASANRMNVQDISDDPFGVRDPNFLTDASAFRKDLIYDPEQNEADEGSKPLEQKLIEAGLNYRIFTTNVILRGAKWSKEQTAD